MVPHLGMKVASLRGGSSSSSSSACQEFVFGLLDVNNTSGGRQWGQRGKQGQRGQSLQGPINVVVVAATVAPRRRPDVRFWPAWC